MRVSAPSAFTTSRDASALRRSSAGSFSLGTASASAGRSAAPQLHAISVLDTLAAIAGADERTERRRRAVQRGRKSLDALDALKLGLLSGDLDVGAVNRLRAAAGEGIEETGDSGLDGILSQIDLRVQVEIAKLTRR